MAFDLMLVSSVYLLKAALKSFSFICVNLFLRIRINYGHEDYLKFFSRVVQFRLLFNENSVGPAVLVN